MQDRKKSSGGLILGIFVVAAVLFLIFGKGDSDGFRTVKKILIAAVVIAVMVIIALLVLLVISLKANNDVEKDEKRKKTLRELEKGNDDTLSELENKYKDNT